MKDAVVSQNAALGRISRLGHVQDCGDVQAMTDGLRRTVTAVLSDGALTTGESTFGEGVVQVVATLATRDAVLALPAPEGARWEVQRSSRLSFLRDIGPLSRASRLEGSPLWTTVTDVPARLA